MPIVRLSRHACVLHLRCPAPELLNPPPPALPFIPPSPALPFITCAGEDDYRVCLSNGVIAKGEGIPCPLDDSGCFMDPVTDFKGQYCKVGGTERCTAVFTVLA